MRTAFLPIWFRWENDESRISRPARRSLGTARMKPIDPKAPVPSPETDDNPDVPLLRTWRAVYIFVLVCFVAVVVALGIFSHVFA